MYKIALTDYLVVGKSNTIHTSKKKDDLMDDLNQKYTSLTATVKLDPNCKASPTARKGSNISDNSGPKKAGLVEVSDEEVKAVLDALQKYEDEFDVIDEIIPLSLKQFWDNFLADNAKFSLGDFLKEREERDINLGEWKPNSDANEENKISTTNLSSSPQPKEENKEIIKEEVSKDEPAEQDETEKIKRELNFTANIRGVPF
jgi:hypothetical protein